MLEMRPIYGDRIIPLNIWKNVPATLLQNIVLEDDLNRLSNYIVEIGSHNLDLGIIELGCRNNLSINKRVKSEARQIYSLVRKYEPWLFEATEVEEGVKTIDYSIYFTKEDLEDAYDIMKAQALKDADREQEDVGDEDEAAGEIVGDVEGEQEIIQRKGKYDVNVSRRVLNRVRIIYVRLLMQIANGDLASVVKALDTVFSILRNKPVDISTQYVEASLNILPPDRKDYDSGKDFADAIKQYNEKITNGKEYVAKESDDKKELLKHWDDLRAYAIWDDDFYPEPQKMAEFILKYFNATLMSLDRIKTIVKGKEISLINQYIRMAQDEKETGGIENYIRKYVKTKILPLAIMGADLESSGVAANTEDNEKIGAYSALRSLFDHTRNELNQRKVITNPYDKTVENFKSPTSEYKISKGKNDIHEFTQYAREIAGQELSELLSSGEITSNIFVGESDIAAKKLESLRDITLSDKQKQDILHNCSVRIEYPPGSGVVRTVRFDRKTIVDVAYKLPPLFKWKVTYKDDSGDEHTGEVVTTKAVAPNDPSAYAVQLVYAQYPDCVTCTEIVQTEEETSAFDYFFNEVRKKNYWRPVETKIQSADYLWAVYITVEGEDLSVDTDEGEGEEIVQQPLQKTKEEDEEDEEDEVSTNGMTPNAINLFKKGGSNELDALEMSRAEIQDKIDLGLHKDTLSNEEHEKLEKQIEYLSNRIKKYLWFQKQLSQFENKKRSDNLLTEEMLKIENVDYKVKLISRFYNDAYTAEEVLLDKAKRGKFRILPSSRTPKRATLSEVNPKETIYYKTTDGNLVIVASRENAFSLTKLDELTEKNIIKPSVGELDPHNEKWMEKDPDTDAWIWKPAKLQQWMNKKFADTGWTFEKLIYALSPRLMRTATRIYYDRAEHMNKKTVSIGDYYQQAIELIPNALMRDRKRAYAHEPSRIIINVAPDSGNYQEVEDAILKNKENNSKLQVYWKKLGNEGTVQEIISQIMNNMEQVGGKLVPFMMTNISRDLGKYARRQTENARWSSGTWPGGVFKQAPQSAPISGWTIIIKQMFNPQDNVLYSLDENCNLIRVTSGSSDLPGETKVSYQDPVTDLTFSSNHIEDMIKTINGFYESNKEKFEIFQKYVLDFTTKHPDFAADMEGGDRQEAIHEACLKEIQKRLVVIGGLEIFSKLRSRENATDFYERTYEILQHEAAGQYGAEKKDRLQVARRWVVNALDAYAKTFTNPETDHNFQNFKEARSSGATVVVGKDEIRISEIISDSVWTIEKRTGTGVSLYDKDIKLIEPAAMTKATVPFTDKAAEIRELANIAMSKTELSEIQRRILRLVFSLDDPQAKYAAFTSIVKGTETLDTYYHDEINNIDIPESVLTGTDEEMAVKLQAFLMNSKKFGLTYYSPDFGISFSSNRVNDIFKDLMGYKREFFDDFKKKVERAANKAKDPQVFLSILGNDRTGDVTFKNYIKSTIIPKLKTGYTFDAKKLLGGPGTLWSKDNDVESVKNAFMNWTNPADPKKTTIVRKINDKDVSFELGDIGARAFEAYCRVVATKHGQEKADLIDFDDFAELIIGKMSVSAHDSETSMKETNNILNRFNKNKKRQELEIQLRHTISSDEVRKIQAEIEAIGDSNLILRSEIVSASNSPTPFTSNYKSAIDGSTNYIQLPPGSGSTSHTMKPPTSQQIFSSMLQMPLYRVLKQSKDENEYHRLVNIDIRRIKENMIHPIMDKKISKPTDKPWSVSNWTSTTKNPIFGGTEFNGLFLPSGPSSTDDFIKPPTQEQVHIALVTAFSDYADLDNMQFSKADTEKTEESSLKWEQLKNAIFDEDITIILDSIRLTTHFEITQVGRATKEEVRGMLLGLGTMSDVVNKNNYPGFLLNKFMQLGSDEVVVKTLEEYIISKIKDVRDKLFIERKKSDSPGVIDQYITYYNIDKNANKVDDLRQSDVHLVKGKAIDADIKAQLSAIPKKKRVVKSEEPTESFVRLNVIYEESDIDILSDKLSERENVDKGIEEPQRIALIKKDCINLYKLGVLSTQEEVNRFVWAFSIWQALTRAHTSAYAHTAFSPDFGDVKRKLNEYLSDNKQEQLSTEKIMDEFTSAIAAIRDQFRKESFGFGDVDYSKDTYVEYFKAKLDASKLRKDEDDKKVDDIKSMLILVKKVLKGKADLNDVPFEAISKLFKEYKFSNEVLINKMMDTENFNHDIALRLLNKYGIDNPDLLQKIEEMNTFDDKKVLELFGKYLDEQDYETLVSDMSGVDNLNYNTILDLLKKNDIKEPNLSQELNRMKFNRNNVINLLNSYINEPDLIDEINTGNGVNNNDLKMIEEGLTIIWKKIHDKSVKSDNAYVAALSETEEAVTPAGIITAKVVEKLHSMGVDTSNKKRFYIGRVLFGKFVYGIIVELVNSGGTTVDIANQSGDDEDLSTVLDKNRSDEYIDYKTEIVFKAIDQGKLYSLKSRDLKFALKHANVFKLDKIQIRDIKDLLENKPTKNESISKDIPMESQNDIIDILNDELSLNLPVIVEDVIVEDIRAGSISDDQEIACDKLVTIKIPLTHFRDLGALHKAAVSNFSEINNKTILNMVRYQLAKEDDPNSQIDPKKPASGWTDEEIVNAVKENKGNTFVRSGNTFFNGPLLYRDIYSAIQGATTFTETSMRDQVANGIFGKVFKPQNYTRDADKTQNLEILKLYPDKISPEEFLEELINIFKAYITSKKKHANEDDDIRYDRYLGEVASLIKTGIPKDVVNYIVDALKEEGMTISGENFAEFGKDIVDNIGLDSMYMNTINSKYGGKTDKIYVGAREYFIRYRVTNVNEPIVKFGKSDFIWNKRAISVYSSEIDRNDLKNARKSESEKSLIDFLNYEFGLNDPDTIYVTMPKEYMNSSRWSDERRKFKDDTKYNYGNLEDLTEKLKGEIAKQIPEEAISLSKTFLGKEKLYSKELYLNEKERRSLGEPDILQKGEFTRKLTDYLHEQYTQFMRLADEAAKFKLHVDITNPFTYKKFRRESIAKKKSAFINKYTKRLTNNAKKAFDVIKLSEQETEKIINSIDKRKFVIFKKKPSALDEKDHEQINDILQKVKEYKQAILDSEIKLRKLTGSDEIDINTDKLENVEQIVVNKGTKLANGIFNTLVDIGHPAIVSNDGTNYLRNSESLTYDTWFEKNKEVFAELDPNRSKDGIDIWVDYFGSPNDAICDLVDNIIGTGTKKFTDAQWKQLLTKATAANPDLDKVMTNILDVVKEVHRLKNLPMDQFPTNVDINEIRRYLIIILMSSPKQFWSIAEALAPDKALIARNMYNLKEGDIDPKIKAKSEKEQAVYKQLDKNEPKQAAPAAQKVVVPDVQKPDEDNVTQLTQIINQYVDDDERSIIIALMTKLYVKGGDSGKNRFIKVLGDKLERNDVNLEKLDLKRFLVSTPSPEPDEVKAIKKGGAGTTAADWVELKPEAEEIGEEPQEEEPPVGEDVYPVNGYMYNFICENIMSRLIIDKATEFCYLSNRNGLIGLYRSTRKHLVEHNTMSQEKRIFEFLRFLDEVAVRRI